MSISVARALTSGVTATLTILRMASGSVCESGPTTKKEMITSSSESVKANKAPDMIAGQIAGIVTLLKVITLFAPKSIAASSNASVSSVNPALTDTRTKGTEKVIDRRIRIFVHL